MSSILTTSRRLPAALLALALGGCAGVDDHLASPVVQGGQCAPRSAPQETWPQPIAGYGCATQANLAAMVANHADLIQGEDPTPPFGDAALAAAQRHRQGQAKAMPTGEPEAKPALVLQDTGSK
jgi:hypothetical protein